MSTFPSILTSYTNPTPTSPLNAPSHSGIETAQNSGLSQLEATVGLAGASSAIGTLYGDLHSPASNGGGHVQSANTGGTGQTSYNKGDTLIASSSSVLSKLSVGADGTVLQADSTQTSGVKWGGVVANKNTVNSGSVLAGTIPGSVLTTLYASSILANTLSTNNAIRFIGEVRSPTIFNDNINFSLNYGNNTLVTFTSTAIGSVLSGTIDGVIMADNGNSNQRGWIRLDVGSRTTGASQGFRQYATGNGTSSVASTADQALTITAQFVTTGISSSIIAGTFIAEKIQ